MSNSIRKTILAGLSALILLLALLNCALRKSKDSEDTGQGAVPPEEIDVVAYANLCKRELGLDPNKILDPWNCLDGTEIETKLEGKSLTAENYESMSSGKKGCDNPSWLMGASCNNYAFIQKRKLSGDVDAVLLCRMRTFSGPGTKKDRLADYKQKQTVESFRALTYFDSLGLIMSNSKTGKTCFFDQVNPSYSGYIPSPDDPNPPQFSKLPEPKPPKEFAEGASQEAEWKRGAHLVWKSPRELVLQDDCIRCHDNGPWKHSPWVGSLNLVPKNNWNVSYQIVGKQFELWRNKFPLRAVTTEDVTVNGKKESQVCTSCHRMGTGATCDAMMGYSTGADWPVPHNSLTTSFKSRNWMPPKTPEDEKLSDEAFEKKWKEKYDAHAKALACCCKNPRAKGCKFQNLIVEKLPPFEVLSDGSNEVCVN